MNFNNNQMTNDPNDSINLLETVADNKSIVGTY